MIFFLTMTRTKKMQIHHHLLCIFSLSPSLLLFFFFFFFFGSFHGVHSAFSAICDTASSSSQCGNIPIRYPFWTINDDDDAPMQCGYPGLGLNCSAGYDYPILSRPEGTYFVTDINYVNKILTVVNIDIAHQGCPRRRHNLTMGSLPLDYNSAYVNLTFLFNCSGRPPLSSPFVAIDCLRFGDKQSYVFVNKSQEKAAALALGCEMVVASAKWAKVTAANATELVILAITGNLML